MTPIIATPFCVQEIVVAGPPVEIQVRVNTGGLVVGVVRRLNWSESLIATMPENKIMSNSVTSCLNNNPYNYCTIGLEIIILVQFAVKAVIW